MYVFGGHTKYGPCNDMWLLQTKKILHHGRDSENLFKWVRLFPNGTEPLPRYGHTSIIIGAHIYIMGGRNDEIFFNSPNKKNIEVHIFSIELCCWLKVDVMGSIPRHRWNACVGVVNSRIYLLGGMNLSTFCGFKLYSLETDSMRV